MNMKWQERRSKKIEGENVNDVRNPWQRDYARVIHSASFRRLQAKTQILNLGDSDFYRTRLTHSLEVAQVGKGILIHLKNKYVKDNDVTKFLPEFELIETICLSHDLGHPPFGHGGEVALNNCMKLYGGFEGNGQTLRIMSKLDVYTDRYGLDLTRRAMLGILKYPVLHSEVVNEKRYEGGDAKPIISEQWKAPKSIFDSEIDVLSWILEPLSSNDSSRFRAIAIGKKKEGSRYLPHSSSNYKSLDCSIMELADDISYGVHDLEDAVSLNLIDKEAWRLHFESEEAARVIKDIELDFDKISDDIFSDSTSIRKKSIGTLVGKLISSIEIKTDAAFDEAILKYNAYMKDNERKFLGLLKKLIVDKVIKSTNVQYLEFRGQRMIGKLFQVLSSDPERFLRESDLKKYKNEDSAQMKMRVISDYIAGMTDYYAVRQYQKLFIPGEGSVFDRV